MWNAEDGRNDIGAGEALVPWRINSSNEIIGYRLVGYNEDPFFRSAAGGVTMIVEDSALSHRAMDINDDGLVVTSRGNLWDQTNGLRHISDAGTYPAGLPAYNPNNPAQLRAVNSEGVIAGRAGGDGLDGLNVGNAYTLTPGSPYAFRSLGAINAESKAVYPNAINSAGIVVGKAWVADGGPWHAFAWDPTNGRMTDLGTNGQLFSEASDVNNSGFAVGAFQDFGETQAALWDLNSGLRFVLDDLVDMPTGWVLRSASGINGNGQIVGSAINAEGNYVPFMASPAGGGLKLPAGLTGATARGDYDDSGFAALGSTGGLAPDQAGLGPVIAFASFAADGDFATLRMDYDPAELAAAGLGEDTVRIYWYNEGRSEWVVAGDASNNTKNPLAQFVLGAPTANLGDWGVDPAGNYAWANIDHASTYGTVAAVPEPATMSLLALGALGLLRRRRR